MHEALGSRRLAAMKLYFEKNMPAVLTETRRAPLAAALVVATLAGCDPGVHHVDWRIEFNSTELRERAVAVEATITTGGCRSDDVLYQTEIALDESAPAPPAMPSGRYGFSARARDASCIWYAGGCRDVVLPEHGSSVVVSVVAVSPEAACSAEVCRSGFCGDEPDADADVDADIDADADVDEAPDGDVEADADEDVDDPCHGGCVACEVCVDGGCVTADDDTFCDGGFCLGGACCTANVAAGVTVIDDLDACFVRITEWWWEEASGYDDHRWWTYAYDRSSAETIGRWYFSVADDGSYLVEAYVPGTAESSRQAVYKIRCGTGPADSEPVDQSSTVGWVTVGVFPMNAGTSRSIFLPDNTGEDRTSLARKLSYDALRITRQ